jgi:hypothetical protein
MTIKLIFVGILLLRLDFDRRKFELIGFRFEISTILKDGKCDGYLGQ